MSERNEAYEEVQRYHVYNVGGEDSYCRDEDVAELEAKYAKLTEAHDIALQALKYIARLYDDSKPVFQVANDAYAMKSEAAMALEKINEVMPIPNPEPYVAPKSNYYVQFRLANELGKKNRWVVCCRENTSPINDKTICDIDGIQADNLPTYEAAERVAAIYNEVMP